MKKYYHIENIKKDSLDVYIKKNKPTAKNGTAERTA